MGCLIGVLKFLNSGWLKIFLSNQQQRFVSVYKGGGSLMPTKVLKKLSMIKWYLELSQQPDFFCVASYGVYFYLSFKKKYRFPLTSAETAVIPPSLLTFALIKLEYWFFVHNDFHVVQIILEVLFARHLRYFPPKRR